MRVVITGFGVLTSIGIGKENVCNALFCGHDGVGDITRFDSSKIKVKRGYEIKEELPLIGQNVTRLVQLGYIAAKEALDESGLKNKDLCLIVGSGLGDEEFVIQLAESKVSLDETPLGHKLGPHLATLLNINGGVISNGNACSAGLFSVAYGFDLIKNNEYESIIVGGAETFSINSLAYFSRVTAGNPQRVCPFDKMRQGMLLGEGAGFLVLESKKSARKRGKKYYAEILGYGLSCDAFHISNISCEGVSKAISNALSDACQDPLDIDYIAAHGTGTPINDKVETEAIKYVYKKHAYSTPISSIKSMIGHTGGASGVIGLISGLFAIINQKIPSTINYNNPDTECDLDYVPNKARKCNVRKVQINSFGFGGTNCSMVIGI